MHADWTLLPRGRFFKRPEIELASSFLELRLEVLALNLVDAEVELASSIIKNLLDKPALLLMLLAVLVLALPVAIPNALASVALLEGITSLSAGRAELLGRGLLHLGPIFLRGFTLSSHRLAERHRTELLSSRQCSFVFSWRNHGCPLFRGVRLVYSMCKVRFLNNDLLTVVFFLAQEKTASSTRYRK